MLHGIQEHDLGALSLELEDYAKRIAEIFDRMDACIERLPSCYQGPPCKTIINRYKSVQASFPTAISNIKSYSSDLLTLINKMRASDKYLASLFEEYTADTNNRIKNEEFDLTKGGLTKWH